MKAILTVYVSPEHKNKVVKTLKDHIGKEVHFISNDLPYLSWIGETELKVAGQKEAFEIERDLQLIPELQDAEVIVEDSAEENELNARYVKTNETINKGKPYYPNPAWFKHRIHCDAALHYAQEAFVSGSGYFNRDESQLTIAMLDTGYTCHPETANIDKQAGRNFMTGENPTDAFDTLESTRPFPLRWGGHGTSCAGLIIGTHSVVPPEHQLPHDNTFYDDLVDGILPQNIKLAPYRISRNIISFTNRMALAINHILQNGATKIISMSHASLLNRKIYRAATLEAYTKGIILVAAPGSHIFSSRNVWTYPAKYPETIAPAASTSQNIPWALTHGGPEVDLCAPGFEIYIPWPFKNKQKLIGFGYKWSEGSSFAVPIVATAAALWRMHHGSKLDQFLPTEQVELFRYIIKKTASPFSMPTNKHLFGAGIINFERLLAYPLERIKMTHLNLAKIKMPSPNLLFETDKKNVSFLRELQYLQTKQLINNESKSISPLEYFLEHASPKLHRWLLSEVKKHPKKTKLLEKLLVWPI